MRMSIGKEIYHLIVYQLRKFGFESNESNESTVPTHTKRGRGSVANEHVRDRTEKRAARGGARSASSNKYLWHEPKGAR